MKRIFILTMFLLMTGVNLYAGNGDLIVNGNVGVGTTPAAKLEIGNTTAAGGILKLDGGDNSSGSNNVTQIAFGYNGANQYPSFIRTRHNSSAANNAIDFYTGDGTANGVFPTDAVLGLSINNGNVAIGATSTGGYKLYVSGSFWASSGPWSGSDSKFKKDILPIENALDKVQKLTGVSYLYKTDEYKDKGFPEGKQLGVIAQELEKVIPEAVMADEEGTKAVNYSEIIPVLIEAIKEQQKEIDNLQSTVTQLQSKAK